MYNEVFRYPIDFVNIFWYIILCIVKYKAKHEVNSRL